MEIPIEEIKKWIEEIEYDPLIKSKRQAFEEFFRLMNRYTDDKLGIKPKKHLLTNQDFWNKSWKELNLPE